MKTVYTSAEISRILEATIGPAKCPVDITPEELNLRRQKRARFIETVGSQAANEITAFKSSSKGEVLVFAGDDICGAYALATASALHKQGIPAKVYLFNIGGDMLSDDCTSQRNRFLEIAGARWLEEVINPGPNFTMPSMNAETIVIDGLFGSDYQKPLRGGYQAVARYINENSPHPRVVSIDIPSGMTLNLSMGMINRNIIHADLTLAIVGPSIAFFMPENAPLVGKWKTLKLPLAKSIVKEPTCRILDAKAVRTIIPYRNQFASKADLGTTIIYAGSYGMLGAAVLAAKAACRSGCGKVIIHGPRCGFHVLQTTVPCALFETDGSDFDIQRFETMYQTDSVAIGPGLGHSDATVYGLERYLKWSYSQKKCLLLDADALNCIASKQNMLDFIPPGSILTPHPGEFDRIFGTQSTHSTRLLKAVEISQRYKIIIVLKGHYTFITWPDGEILINASGTNALATAGSGDVLTGLMAGLMAQGMASEIAAAAAVYIHGIAGRMAASHFGCAGTTAQDITEYIGLAIENIANPKD